MPELATAWVTLAISAKDARRDIKKVFDGVDTDARVAGSKAGKEFSRSAAANTNLSGLQKAIGAAGTAGSKAMSVALKAGLAGAALTAAAGVAGVVKTLTSGFDRLKAIDTAKTKLRALGNDAGAVSKIMDSALASVKGTAFGMDEAVTTAASAVAAGIKPGQELQKYLTGVADAAALSGSSLSEMGSIFNKVQTNGRAMTDDLQQLGDRGIPIFQYLQKVTGKTGEDFRKFVEDGGINAALFNQAIQQNIGGAAVIMGQSFEGSIQNAKAAVSRLGAALLQPVFGNFAGGVGSITDALDAMTKWVDAHQAGLITFFQNLGNVAITAAENLAHGAGGMLQAIGDIAGGIGNIEGAVLKFEAFQADVRGDHETADELRRQSEAAFGWGESIRAMGDKLANLNLRDSRDQINQWGAAAREAAANAESASGKVTGLATALGALPLKKVIAIDADTAQADADLQAFKDRWAQWTINPSISPVVPPNRPPGTIAPGDLGGLLGAPGHGGGRAGGGPINGPGPKGRDSVLFWGAPGEHVFTDKDVDAMGGQGAVYAFRNMLHRSGGGKIWKTGALIWPPEPVGPSDKNRPGGVPNLGPGRGKNQIGLPDWSTPGQTFGPPSPGWWDRPVNPDDILFPEWMPPGMREEWMRRWGDRGKRWKPLGFAGGGAIGDWMKLANVDQKGPWHLPYFDEKAPGSGPYLKQLPGWWLEIINKATFPWWMPAGPGRDPGFHPGGPGFAGGGAIPSSPGDFIVTRDDIMSALQFAESVNGNPYQWGGTGPLYDCSGFISAIYGITTGRPLPAGQRYFTTESDFTKLGFARGFDPSSPLNIGVHNTGNPRTSHIAGTLAGFNVESGGSAGKTQIGGTAAGANDPQFENKYHLLASIAQSGEATGSELTQHYSDSLTQGGEQAVKDISSSAGGGTSGGGDASSFGQSLVSGLLQGIGLDGSVFSNPFDWPNVKSGLALVNWGGGFLKALAAKQRADAGGGDAGVDLSGGSGGPNIGDFSLPGVSDFLKPQGPNAMTPNAAPPGTPASGTGAGPAPGPAYIINGNVGMDPRAVTQRFDAAANQAWRRSMTAVRPGQ